MGGVSEEDSPLSSVLYLCDYYQILKLILKSSLLSPKDTFISDGLFKSNELLTVQCDVQSMVILHNDGMVINFLRVPWMHCYWWFLNGFPTTEPSPLNVFCCLTITSTHHQANESLILNFGKNCIEAKILKPFVLSTPQCTMGWAQCKIGNRKMPLILSGNVTFTF